MLPRPGVDSNPLFGQRAPLRLWYLARVTATLARCLGFDAAQRWAARLARGLFELDPPLRRQVEENILSSGIAPAAQAPQTARQFFEHTARFWVELLFISRHLRPSAIPQHVAWHQPQAWNELA